MNKTVFNLIRQNRWLCKMLFSCQKTRCENFLSRIQPHITVGSSVLDIGAGTCNMTALLQNQGVNTTALDIADLSIIENVKPVLYDGLVFPFADNTFDVALILTVLHHCSNPGLIIKEASRVASKIIIIEDVLKGPLHSMGTKSFDSLLNFEFIKHPHQNKTDKEWCRLFDELGLRLIEKKATWSFLVMWQVTYVLKRI